jgi:hypothetical protein
MLLITKILSERAGAGPAEGLGQTLDYFPQLCNRLLHNCRDTVTKEALRLSPRCRDNRYRRFPVPNPFIIKIITHDKVNNRTR